TVVRCTEVRSTLEHLARDPDFRLAGVVACSLRPAARVFRDAAHLRRIGFVLGRPPVGRPFPDIADHVADAVAVRWERSYRRGSFVAILTKVLIWKLALPRVGHMLAARRELVAPGELGAVEPAARGELPFGLRRQFLAGPFRIGFGIAV